MLLHVGVELFADLARRLSGGELDGLHRAAFLHVVCTLRLDGHCLVVDLGRRDGVAPLFLLVHRWRHQEEGAEETIEAYGELKGILRLQVARLGEALRASKTIDRRGIGDDHIA